MSACSIERPDSGLPMEQADLPPSLLLKMYVDRTQMYNIVECNERRSQWRRRQRIHLEPTTIESIFVQDDRHLKVTPLLWFSLTKHAGLLKAVALCYRNCSGATFTVAVAPLLLIEKNGDVSAATFVLVFLALRATATFELRQSIFWVSITVLELKWVLTIEYWHSNKASLLIWI